MMRKLKNKILLLLPLILLQACTSPHTSKENIEIKPPEELYGQLFYDVQSNPDIFSDSKLFVDAVPQSDVNEIRANYEKLSPKTDAAIVKFIEKNFKLATVGSTYKSDSLTIKGHISNLWELLKRPADKKISGTLIPLPYPYIIPGGRFREIYYWDSYFTMLGLQVDNQIETIQNMVDNFSYLIDLYGFIPNGNRTYYLSRSQPPFYAMMIDILAESKSDSIYSKYLKSLEKEYAFWMDGSDKLNRNITSYRRVVMLPDGEVLNRYWDDMNTPRAESYREDINTAKEALEYIPECKQEEVFRNLRAAAESGWDFSSRWLTPGKENRFSLYTIHTTDILPVDLNSLIYNMEYTLSKSYERTGNIAKAKLYKTKYEARKKAIMKYCWNAEKGFFMDFDFKIHAQTDVFSIAGVFPLFFHIADKKQANQVANKIRDSFLKDGGVIATLNHTGQQWDAPNGWAPLQWIAIRGLKNYGHDALANTIKHRWLQLNRKVYESTYKMLEKYNVEDLNEKGGGGEYPNQDGFGWTNGVFQKLSQEE